MKYVTAVSLFITILMISSCAEASLDYYGTEVNIDQDQSVNCKILFKFKEPVEEFTYFLSFNIYNLSISSNFDLAECRAENFDKFSSITCAFSGMTEESNRLILYFDTDIRPTYLGNRYNISYIFNFPLSADRFSSRVKLPTNSVLSEDIITTSFFPDDGETATDGKHIMVFWDRTNIEKDDNLMFSVLYKMPGTFIDYTGYVIAVLIIVVVLVVFFFNKGRKKSKQEITSILDKDEKAVIDILRKHEGKAVQKVIVRETDFSKAKVSRLVKDLKSRDIIDIEPVSGRENRIILKIKL